MVKRIFFLGLGVVVVGVVLGGFWFSSLVRQPGPFDRRSTFVVAKGDKVRDIGAQLAHDRLIRAPWQWNLYVVLAGKRAAVLPGTYVLDAHLSIRQLANLLTTLPDSSREVEVTVREGLRAKDIAELLEKNDVVTANDFLRLAESSDRQPVPGRQFPIIASRPADAGLEGFLFPDTYRFFHHMSAADVLGKFLDNFTKKFTPSLQVSIRNHDHQPYDGLIMASIVEAELRTEHDRAMAADIFWRRNAAGMTLNADTTIYYALGRKTGELSNTDLHVDSAFNTYTHAGLPPTPINNPGLSAIRAAAEPVANDYWYYLTAPSGQTIFAKTLEEHAANKRRYLTP